MNVLIALVKIKTKLLQIGLIVTGIYVLHKISKQGINHALTVYVIITYYHSWVQYKYY